MQSPFVMPARTGDGRDVIIRLVTLGGVGLQHREAMLRLGTGNIASVIGNHTVPVLQWLHLDDLSFAVLPFLLGTDPTWFYLYENLHDLLKSVIQMCEVCRFLSEFEASLTRPVGRRILPCAFCGPSSSYL